jgi:REP element-mobilizing transposase RayT
MTTHDYIPGVRDLGWVSFRGRLWQRNYYERIIRDEEELNLKRLYIVENPLRWAEDPDNLDALS